MNKQFLVAIPMAIILIMLDGCAIGYDTLMFVSKTNAGFEIDTQPPSIQVSIDRLESVVAPSYEEGKTPPVLGSFQFNGSGGLLATGMGSAFAAGDAAFAMAILYDAADHKKVAGVKPEIGPHKLDFKELDWGAIDRRGDPEGTRVRGRHHPGSVAETGGASADGAAGLERRRAPGAEEPGAEEAPAGAGDGIYQRGVGGGSEGTTETAAHQSPDLRTDPDGTGTCQ